MNTKIMLQQSKNYMNQLMRDKANIHDREISNLKAELQSAQENAALAKT